jgi:hypothetical protein
VTTASAHAPERTAQQRRDALARANEIRTARKELKRALKAGRIGLADVLERDDCATWKISKALLALPTVGRVKANRALTRAKISPSKTLGGLTPRQKAELLELLPTKQRAGTRPARADYPEAVLAPE